MFRGDQSSSAQLAGVEQGVRAMVSSAAYMGTPRDKQGAAIASQDVAVHCSAIVILSVGGLIGIEVAWSCIFSRRRNDLDEPKGRIQLSPMRLCS